MQDSGAPGKKSGHPNDFAEEYLLPLEILAVSEKSLCCVTPLALGGFVRVVRLC